MAAALFPQNEEEFMEWFWKEDNGNELIHKLNAYSFNNYGGLGSDFIRREKYSPSIYGLVFEFRFEAPEWYKTINDHKGQIKLMKIGFTHRDTAPKSDNRMEQVMKQVKRSLSENEKYDVEVKTLFKLPIDFADNTIHSTVEGNIRQKMGVPVPRDLAEMFRLPVPTEWVFTTKTVTTAFEDMITTLKLQYQQGNKKKVKRVLTTEVFTSPSFSYGKYDIPANSLQENVESLKTKF